MYSKPNGPELFARAKTWFVCIALAVLGLAGARPVSQAVEGFSGVWALDQPSNGPVVDVWGQTRAGTLEIRDVNGIVTVRFDEGGLSVPAEVLQFRHDGQPSHLADTSLGVLPNFERFVRTEWSRENGRLILEVEPYSRSTEPATGRVKIGRGITSVLRMQLANSGRQLVVERTGYRAEPPSLLHGRPYRREDDLVYNIDVVKYVRVRE